MNLKQSKKALQEIFDEWYIDSPSVKGEVVKTIDYKERNSDKLDSKEWGTFQTLNTDFAGKKLIVKDLPEMIGKDYWQVGEYIKEKGWTPVGHEAIQHFMKTAEKLKESYLWFYCFGSLFRRSYGHWSVPCVRWDGASFKPSGSWLGDGWSSLCRVVLLETELVLDPLNLPLESLAFLELRVKKLESLFKPELLK